MKKFLPAVAALMFFSAVLLASAKSSAAATTRFATCDACGYCPFVANITPVPTCYEDKRPLPTGNPAPGNWGACVKCLYPGIYGPNTTPDPSSCDTVRIIGDAPPTPYAGHQYTMLGCLTTASTDIFQNTSAKGASSFVQAIFNLLVFRVVGGIAFLYLMYGAFILMTSQADPEKLNYGRRVMMGAAIGLIFSLGSVFIVNLIGSGILKIPGFGSP